jgi:small GTP-binding protein
MGGGGGAGGGGYGGGPPGGAIPHLSPDGRRHMKKKIVILGDPAVGKTSLIRRYVVNAFDEKYISTIGARVSKKEVSVSTVTPPVRMDMMIWDLIGSKESSRLHEMYYKGAEGALVVCDISRLSTIENMGMWVESFRKGVGDRPALLIINKADLQGFWTLDEDGMESLAARHHTFYYMTSAKTGANVESAFLRLAEEMVLRDLRRGLDDL